MYNDFNQYPGAPANYTKEMLLADFPRGEKRPAGNGKIVSPGFLRGSGFGRAYVGDKVLRVEHPEGAHSLRFTAYVTV